ncbi:Amidohydrolase 3 [Candidatus Koribacter versatilis Ellin345]|uniref:Amidohydrolase 3 n=1 Tax=Koribacter versatilis (strain Ellin345) TaxID=204669 RepID=Q1IHF7_KORVE|nr:amidohydrolase [Candidatus Koribacter versatilis]ABF43693.1 Amidohydrolase 3 [Candidatus Koribacter versatilis Ellin345]
MRRIFSTIAFCLLLACIAFAADERILYNGKIFTADTTHPYAEAVAIRGDKIVAVGTFAEVSKAVSGSAEKVDLKGNLLLPGLIDSHAHAVDGGLSLISADLGESASTMEDLFKFAAESRKNGRGMMGDVLDVSGLPLEYWSHNKELNEHFNSGDYAKVPVYLEGMDGHTAWANKVLLERAGINKQLISGLDQTARGYYGFSKDLEPNGFLVDLGNEKVEQIMPKPDAARMLSAARAAVDYMHHLGITAWLDPAVSDAILAAYRGLAEKGELKSHVGALPVIAFKKGDPDGQFKHALDLRESFKDVPDVKVIGIKVFADGVAEIPSQTAVMSKPYLNTGRTGELLFKPEDFQRICVAAEKNGMIIHVHAIGDQAVTEALNGIQAARSSNPSSKLPHTITHLQFVRPEDISRIHDLKVIASMQLLWARAEVDSTKLLKPYIDPYLYGWQYPARSILDTGATVAGASDWPVSTADVFQAIYTAETRKGPEGVLDPSQRMPREAMLYAYTINAARALDRQESIGSIAEGKQADFALVDRDVLTIAAEDVRDTKVLWTVFGGETVYGAKP